MLAVVGLGLVNSQAKTDRAERRGEGEEAADQDNARVSGKSQSPLRGVVKEFATAGSIAIVTRLGNEAKLG